MKLDLSIFKNPGVLYRNAPFWSWNDRLDSEELKRQIRQMADKGWGGFFMHSRVGLVTGYLSDEWMDRISESVREAEKNGLHAWLYDEDKWPSGYAGGKVPLMDERYRSRALVLLKENEALPNDTLMLEYEYEGIRYSIAKRVSALGDVWFNGACYTDLMNPEAVKAFIQCTHEKYRERLEADFGKVIPGIFIDEPCYLVHSFYDRPVIPWSEGLPAFFLEMKGYDVTDYLPALFFDIYGYEEIRYDYYDCATRLFVRSFTRQYAEWCDENHLIMTGHLNVEDDHIGQSQWIGAAMPHYEWMQWPGIDKLRRDIKQHVTVKQLTSVVDQLGKRRALSESFGCMGQQASFFHRKWVGDWQAALGINFVNSHLSLYSMRGERKRDYPANLFYQQPWWDEEGKYAQYTARLCYALTCGKREVDILVIHTISSIWCTYSPLHAADGYRVEKELYDKPFNELAGLLLAEKLDFHFGDEMIMERHGSVENGKIRVGRHVYSTIVVPPSLSLSANTLQLINAFAEAAGPERVIFTGKRPSLTEGGKVIGILPKGAIRAASAEETIKVLNTYYPDRVKVIDKQTGQNAEKVLCHIRNNGRCQIIFIANTAEDREIYATVTLPGKMALMALDLMSGNLYKMDEKIAQPGTNSTQIDVKLYPAGSLLLYAVRLTGESKEEKDSVFSECTVEKCPNFFDSGVEFLNNTPGVGGGKIKKSSAYVASIRDFNITLHEDNVLPLAYMTLYIDNRCVLSGEHVSKAWNEHFYRAPEGTPFSVEYCFDAEGLPVGEVFAVVECAENLDDIIFNGVRVKALKSKGESGTFSTEKSWKDISFTKIPINGLIRYGVNRLAIKGKKVNNIIRTGRHLPVEHYKTHHPTEVEMAYIVGRFSVGSESRRLFYMESPDENRLRGQTDITRCGYPFYTGKVSYQAKLNFPGELGRVYAYLHEVRAACARLRVNEQQVDVQYWEPYRFDITDFLKKGENELEVILSNTLFNLEGPNWTAGIADMPRVGPWDFVKAQRFTEKYEIMPFGMESIRILRE